MHTRHKAGEPAANNSGRAFDTAAGRYDADATRNPMMGWLRRESLSSLRRAFGPGDRVLEVGCGTGEEAVALARNGVHVVATDASPVMVEVTSRKFSAQGFEAGQAEAFVLPVEEMEDLVGRYGMHTLDGAYSSLGALNCAPDLAAAASSLGRLVRPGGVVVISLLGKYCLWETLWYVAHANTGLAFRRWRGRATGTAIPGGPHLTVYYWPLRYVEQQFSPYFEMLESRAMPWILPPTYAASWLRGRPRLLRLLSSVERSTSRYWPFYTLGDHVQLVIRRKG
ncbi:MAG: class I SAM-dependent methyltransferase [Chloroflexia bacterium]